ncbi:MAG: hypothetical protein EOO07_35695, partial [Chitinophagaceae bacterium]
MRLLLLAILLFLSVNLLAQQPPRLVVTKPLKDTIALKLDSSKTQVRKFDNEAIQKYKSQKEFQYGDEEPKGLNWWQRFWRNFWNWIDRLFGQQESIKSSPSIWPVV